MDVRYFFLLILFLAHCSPQQPHTTAMVRKLKASCAPQSSDVAFLRQVQKNNPPLAQPVEREPSFFEKLKKRRTDLEKTVFSVAEKHKFLKINAQSFTVLELFDA
jgi:hypothetical protein